MFTARFELIAEMNGWNVMVWAHKTISPGIFSSAQSVLSWLGLQRKYSRWHFVSPSHNCCKTKFLPICYPPFWISFLDVLVSKTIIQGVVFVSSLNQFCVLHFPCICSFVSSLLATVFCFHVNFSRIFFSANFSFFSVPRGPHHLRGVQGQPCLEGLPIH